MRVAVVAGPEEVVRGDVLAVRQHREAGRADVLLRLRGRERDDDAGRSERGPPRRAAPTPVAPLLRGGPACLVRRLPDPREHVRPLRPRLPLRGQLLHLLRAASRRGRAARSRSASQVVQLPRPAGALATSFQSPTRTARLPSCSQKSASRSSGLPANAGTQALALQRRDRLAVARRVRRPGHVDAGRHHVDQVAGLVAQLALGRDARRPVGDQRRADAALVDPVLVLAERRVD